MSADEWPTLVRLDAAEPPPLPLDRLPGALADMAQASAQAAQIDPAVPALLGLGAVATVAQKTARVAAVPRWSESLSLFVVAVADVSERKSASYGDMAGPLYELEVELDEATREVRIHANEERRLRAAELDKLRKDAAHGKAGERPGVDTLAEAAAELEALGPERDRPRLIVDDITPEALKGVMADNGGRAALLSPEASFLSVLAGAYTGNGKPADISGLLSAYTGSEPIVVDRRGRANERIPAPSLTLVMVGQPAVFRELTRVPGASERGLIARFVAVRVPSLAGRRPLDLNDTPAPADTPAGVAYARTLRALSHREVSDHPPVLFLDAAALEVYREWHDELEAERGPDGRWAGIAGFAGKAHGLALRYAGLSYLCDHPGATEADRIGADTLTAALELADWSLLAHEAAVVGAGLSDVASRALRVVKAAERGTLARSREERGPWAPVTHRDLRLALGNAGRPLGQEDVEEVFEVLKAHGYGRWDQTGAFHWHPELNGGAR